MKARFLLLLGLLAALGIQAQRHGFSRADSLRGSLRPERSCYDVTFYDLEIKVDPDKKEISGSNTMHFDILEDFSTLQVDLFDNMSLDKASMHGKELKFKREHHAIFIDFPEKMKKGGKGKLRLDFSGKPIVAARAPWDGGFVWSKDKNDKHWVGVACEGTGASLWWPNKDHLSDEPDSMRIALTAPADLMAVANGQLRGTKDVDAKWKQWDWFVSYPINNYNVTVNIADYAHIHDTYKNASGTHDLDYYVLSYNEEKARKQFAQVTPMLEVFEEFFGEYPFWKDGYALVETPYLGMEHQGAIAYGNHYLPGYNGFDPLNLKFDYIVIHESGHEWWGNSVSCKDHAELWIHESFCTYSEAIYVEKLWDYETAIRYLLVQRTNIVNATPIVGPLGVNYNHWRGSDMYYKGAWMLHTIRHVVGDDEKWWGAIRDFAQSFKHKTTDTKEVIAWFNEKLGQDLSWLWKEYLYYARPPQLEYKMKAKGSQTQIKCRWVANQEDFRLKVPVISADGKKVMIAPTTEWQKFTVDIPLASLKIDKTTWYGGTKDLKK